MFDALEGQLHDVKGSFAIFGSQKHSEFAHLVLCNVIIHF
jgi:hypothetical protein